MLIYFHYLFTFEMLLEYLFLSKTRFYSSLSRDIPLNIPLFLHHFKLLPKKIPPHIL